MADGHATVGIDVGGTKVLGVVVGADDGILEETRVPTPAGSDALVAAVVGVADHLIRSASSSGVEVVAVGVGLPGFVDRSGLLRFAPNLPGVVELPLARLGSDATGLPWEVDNDATCALWAEHLLGAARGSTDAVLVTLGTGIGGGVLSGGRLVRGAHGFAGEIGHMVVDLAGIPCPCGRRGCWERYAAGSALGRLAREAVAADPSGGLLASAGGDPLTLTGEHVTTAAASGDAVALGVLATYADWFAVGRANLVHILDLDHCVIGGGLISSGEVVLEPIRRAFADRVVAPDHRPDVEIVAAQLGHRAGAVGAALLARQRSSAESAA